MAKLLKQVVGNTDTLPMKHGGAVRFAVALIALSTTLSVIDVKPALALSPYASQILADSPSLYWRLGEAPAATSIVDSSSHNAASVLSGSPTFGVNGAITGDSDTAAGMAGTYAYTSSSYTHSNVFTVETWFKTSTNLGGTLISFCDNGADIDRAVWMDNAGKLVFAVFPTTAKTITSASAYNNGAWHMAAATLSAAGMILYVDGKQVAIDASTTTAEATNERWRLGAATTVINGFGDHGTNLGLSGQQDEVAVWNTTALTATQIQNEYSAAIYGASEIASVTVDPSFTFAVAGMPGATGCNGVPVSTVSTSANAVGFGHLSTSAESLAVQQLQVATNAGDGYLIYMRSNTSTPGVLAGAHSHVIADSGAGPMPAQGSEFFGYSTDSTAAAISPGNLKSVPLTTGADVVGNGLITPSGNNCVVFAIGTSATTAADAYFATIIYTAVPTF